MRRRLAEGPAPRDAQCDGGRLGSGGTTRERQAAWRGRGVVATSKSRGPIVRYRSYTPGADAEGDIDALPLWAGQSVALVKKVQPAAEIDHEIHSEASAILQRLGTTSG